MSLELYPEVIRNGYVIEGDGEDIEGICEEIHAACEGFGTDEERLLKAMGSHPPETRCRVGPLYERTHGKRLDAVIKSECGSRDFGTALQFLASNPITAECAMLEKALEKKEKDVAYSIICGRTNHEMMLLRSRFYYKTGKDLVVQVMEQFGGDFEKLLVTALQAPEQKYDPDYHTEDRQDQDVNALHKYGQGKLMGTDEAGIFKVLCMVPPDHLKAILPKYEETHGKSLEDAMKGELSGELENATLFLINIKTDPHATIASLIEKACAGFGTDELLLTTVLIRYQSVMKDVEAAHVEKYSQTIEERITSETGGDYQKLLLEVLQTGLSL